MLYIRLFFVFSVIVFVAAAFSPAGHAQDGAVPFTTDRWDFDSSKGAIVQQGGQQSLRLSTTAATLKDVVFRDGIIEVDVSMPDDGSGFAYIQFRNQQISE